MFARKAPLSEGNIYHVYTRSIAGYKVFNSCHDYRRALGAVRFYNCERPVCSFSRAYLKTTSGVATSEVVETVRIIAYCLMPTHLHLVLKQLRAHGISQYIGRLLNSYSRYFNKRYERKGPLWESRFQSLLVESDEQLLHLTRYLHLNPVTAGLVESPETWEYSSYREYLGLVSKEEGACNYSGLLEIGPLAYQRFVCNRIDYQRKLARIKNLLIEEKSPFLRQPRRLQPTRL